MAAEISTDDDKVMHNKDKIMLNGGDYTFTLLNALPDEILEFVLTYLPPYGDLKNCALVCKRWNHVVKNLIRRSKLNFQSGLLDFRLRWEVFSQETAVAVQASRNLQNPFAIIAGRFAHSAVRHENDMYVFGGGSSSDTTFNDLWRFDLTEMRWARPISMGTYPSPKGSASMVAWRDQLILFGGWRYPSLHPPYQPWCLFDELHYYDIPTNRWQARSCMPSPPCMAGHSATVHGDHMIVFGGYQIKEDVNINSNDLWVLDIPENRWWQPRLAGNVRPSPRYGQIQIELGKPYLLIVGGCGGANRLYSDAWLLDMTYDPWEWKAIPVKNKKFGALHMWCNPACKINKYLVALGPTPNMPQDFQMMKQSRLPVGGGIPGMVGGGIPGMPPNIRFGGALGQPGPPPPPLPQQQQHIQLPERRIAGDDIPHVQVNRLDNLRPAAGVEAPADQYYANRRAILNQHLQHANNFLNNNLNNNNNYAYNLQPRTGRLGNLHAQPQQQEEPPQQQQEPQAEVPPAEGAGAAIENNQNRPTSSRAVRLNNGINNGARNNNEDMEAYNRLQRNLALRCRDNEPLLPKRFDDVYEDPFRMAAFNVQRSRSASRDHTERIRRMEEKMNAIRNSRRNNIVPLEQKPIKEPSPKRVRRNVQSLFVCDIEQVLHHDEPYLEWVEFKNFGIVPGAPDRLILSSLIAGNGELILFGGVHKETLSGITHHVSNSIHFLGAPRDIV